MSIILSRISFFNISMFKYNSEILVQMSSLRCQEMSGTHKNCLTKFYLSIYLEYRQQGSHLNWLGTMQQEPCRIMAARSISTETGNTDHIPIHAPAFLSKRTQKQWYLSSNELVWIFTSQSQIKRIMFLGEIIPGYKKSTRYS